VRDALGASRFGLKYLAAYHLRRCRSPLIRGIVLTNRCNLRCRHCDVASREPADLSFSEVRAAIDEYFREGGRCLYLEGGEPFLWRDGIHGLDDVVGNARRRGYRTVVVYTNGCFPLETTADTVFVSVDGTRATHDALRGPSFERILENVRRSAHPSLYLNCTVNTVNQDELAAVCELVRAEGNLRGVFFYLHTPYYGHDDLELDAGARTRVLDELLTLRRRYPVLNSAAGLRAALRDDWARPLPVCTVYEKGEVHECCRYSGDPELCRHCGYLSYAEVDQALKLRPTAILGALAYFRVGAGGGR
jgi:MoaA/NifB/PqqE/SkfB family radical SAM enzyme